MRVSFALGVFIGVTWDTCLLSIQILPLPNVVFFWNLFRSHAHWRAFQVNLLAIPLLNWTLLEWSPKSFVVQYWCTFCDDQSSTRLKMLLTEGEAEPSTVAVKGPYKNSYRTVSSQNPSWVSFWLTIDCSQCQILERSRYIKGFHSWLNMLIWSHQSCKGVCRCNI